MYNQNTSPSPLRPPHFISLAACEALPSSPQPSNNLRAFPLKLIAHSTTAIPNGAISPKRSARGSETSEEMKEDDLPETKPRAKERPKCVDGESWDNRVSCTTEIGVKPSPKMNRPEVCYQLHSDQDVPLLTDAPALRLP
jgi:hypothetical protein